MFLACSAACLDRHRREVHASTGAEQLSLSARVQRSQEALNRKRQGWEVYESHRGRLERLLRAVQREQGLCVLGAGNCDDLDLPVLVREFGEVHLVDLDGAAMNQALERVPPAVRAKVVLHAGVDLSGAVALVDDWGERFPDDAALEAFSRTNAADIARGIGRRFDVVLSACLLSQLYVPLRESLILGLADWQRLFAAIDRAHLGTVAALARPGGTGVLALDVTNSRKLPELSAFTSPTTWDGLGSAIPGAIARRQVTLDPDPRRVQQLASAGLPGLGVSIERVRLTDPWVWDTGGGVQALVYALVFTSGAG